MTTYVIREQYFGYNDEVFYVAGNRIANVFEDKQQAEAVYKQLEINGARDFALYEVESLFDADETLLKKLDDFVFSRSGDHIYQDGEVSRDTLPESLSDEDTFEFIQLANMQKFQLVQFEHEAKFYALWSVKQQKWVEEHDECFAGLIYSESLDAFKSKVEHIVNQSLKLEIMAHITKKSGWSKEKVKCHSDEMIAIIDNDIRKADS